MLLLSPAASKHLSGSWSQTSTSLTHGALKCDISPRPAPHQATHCLTLLQLVKSRGQATGTPWVHPEKGGKSPAKRSVRRSLCLKRGSKVPSSAQQWLSPHLGFIVQSLGQVRWPPERCQLMSPREGSRFFRKRMNFSVGEATTSCLAELCCSALLPS